MKFDLCCVSYGVIYVYEEKKTSKVVTNVINIYELKENSIFHHIHS